MVRAIEIMIIAIEFVVEQGRLTNLSSKKEVYHNMYLQEYVYFLLKSNPYQA